jgi:hypothetical protein
MQLRCEDCRHFFSSKDIDDGIALHQEIEPLSYYDRADWEVVCASCTLLRTEEETK